MAQDNNNDIAELRRQGDAEKQVYEILLDAAESENAALRAENTALRNFCIQQILLRHPYERSDQ